MTIHFYLDNKEETHIASFHDMEYQPFKVGDVLNLSVDEIVNLPPAYYGFNDEVKTKLLNEFKERHIMFNNKKVKLVREGKYLDLKTAVNPLFIVEFHCVLVAQ